ncbi:restriction endonuclease [Streptomyces sp. NPDC005279]|uniref:restriction endonuclease n=1 Tax=Streptomyces sp. NPDC005279 TaxID=3364712 RepID=UPI003699DDE4
MTSIDGGRVATLLAAGDTAVSNAARGKAFEDLLTYLFELIPGISASVRNQLDAFSSEEIDIAFWNDGDPNGLRQFDQIILVECKNWSKPVGAPEVTIFNAKLEARGRPLGILVAASGITGDADDLSAAHQILFRALGQKREILVVTRSEIEQLCDTDDLVRLLKRKKLQLAVSGTIYGVS